MSSFISSLATKAQSAYEQSPISSQVSHLQSKLQSQGGSADQPSANKAAAQGGIGAKSQVLGNISHQFRNLQMQYANVTPTQRIITSQKGVCLAFEGVAKDAKSQSKELYMWGQNQDEDIKDVTDRLAYLNFVHGALSASLASKLDASRSSLKALRDVEKAIEPKRNLRSGLQTQIARLEHDQQRGSGERMADLKKQLLNAEAEDESAEKNIDVLKRKAVADSEREKWDALREYGEKLVLLAEASTSIVSALPSVPPTSAQPYTGAQATAATRASLQQALDNFTPGSISHSFQPSAADIGRSDSRSFGVTHATELSGIASPSIHSTVHTDSHVQASPPLPTGKDSSSPPPVNPTALNNAPTPIPHKMSPDNGSISKPASSVVSAKSASPVEPSPIHVPEPTIAETGIPVSAGPEGPGPSSGSLKDLKAAAPGKASAPAPSYPSAEEEKTRLLREDREDRERLAQSSAPAPAPTSAPPQKFETAEEEKNRLEKEEKDRLLKEAETQKGGSKDAEGDGTTPPPYQDM